MTMEQKVIKNKVGLLNLAQSLGNVSQACKVMGFSRDSSLAGHASELSDPELDFHDACHASLARLAFGNLDHALCNRGFVQDE